nr:tricin synthase 1-like isoform X3 [Ipomoea batatas]
MPPMVVEMDNVARLSEGHRRCSGAYGRRRPPPSSNLSSDDTDPDPHQLEETASSSLEIIPACLVLESRRRRNNGRDCILVQILVLRDWKAAQQLFGPLTNREQIFLYNMTIVTGNFHLDFASSISVSPDQAQLLAMLVQVQGAKWCIEVGIYTLHSRTWKICLVDSPGKQHLFHPTSPIILAEERIQQMYFKNSEVPNSDELTV